MRILFVGAGAVGGYFGSRLAAAGRDVSFLVHRGRAEALRRDGLRVALGPAPDAATEVLHDVHAVVADGSTPVGGPFDVIVVAVKAYALDAALDDIEPFVGPDTMVLPLLNGLRHIDTLVARFGEHRVLGGLCVVAAQLDPDGTVRLLAPGATITYGELDGSLSPRIRALDEQFQLPAPADGGFKARASQQIEADLWSKWVFLSSGGAVTTLLNGTVGQITATPTGPETARAIVAECAAVAAASGFALPPRSIEAVERQVTEPGSGFTTSMYRDLQAGRPVEADAIVGDLVARAASLGVSVPLLSAAYARLRVYVDGRA
ncbi:ketopantoate reductase family protein [Herbiconiux daphne]|uniref:2-dehydropantoate 2-reductase n=1 Tax=Herbiconiux daphne TaxID=2970914 RepID=A0ABT2H3V5_9MICO|nr:ketopantoate reductase family protein [Herbiconiux daphne]MCS5734608.1 ketopantoate reductase family protein [Herbiconiux daphne]